MMALRHISHVLHRTTASFIRLDAGIRRNPLICSYRTYVRSVKMASEYVAVEKGTPNSANFRVFFSEYILCILCVPTHRHKSSESSKRADGARVINSGEIRGIFVCAHFDWNTYIRNRVTSIEKYSFILLTKKCSRIDCPCLCVHFQCHNVCCVDIELDSTFPWNRDQVNGDIALDVTSTHG